MTARRTRGRFKGPSQDSIIGILLAVVIIQGFFLFKAYYKPSEGKRPARRHTAVERAKPKKRVAAPVAPATAVLPQVKRPRPAAAHQGDIAIIVDDSGNNDGDCDHLSEIPYPVTVSILPDLKYSRTIASCAHRNDKEVMLHFPMQPHENSDKYPADYLVTTSMSPSMVKRRLEESLDSVPFADGLNNHMGSKATENQRLMSIVFGQLKNKGLFFVDSRVTSKSVCPQLAKKLGIPFTERDVFLDNVNEREAIERQFEELKGKAKERGYAIAIGHARSLTWQIIKEQTQALTEQGFRIVTVEDIIRRHEN